MNKRSRFSLDADYLLIIVLLLFSGDPIVRLTGKYAALLTSLTIFILFFKKIKKDFYVLFLGIASGLLLLFVWQYALLGFVSWLGAFNYINTYLLGGLIIYLLAERFTYKLFIIVSYISIISLVLFVFINILNISVPGIVWKADGITYIVYTLVEQHHYRNCGAFWEPGAFGGILTLCLALNVNQLPVLLRKHPLKVAAIILAVITTQSTTAYFVLFLIGSYFLVFIIKDKTIAFIVLPLLVVIGVAIYSNAAFLQNKIEYQAGQTEVLAPGEFSNTRFGSLIFDMHYIQKHPIIGNGFSEITRYADNPEIIQLIQMGENLGNGNGMSNFTACLGIPFMFFYILLSFNAISRIDQKMGILATFVILLSMFSEQWLSYPLYAGIMFIRNRKNDIQ